MIRIASALLVLVMTSAPAAAIEPPVVDPSAPLPPASAGPVVAMTQRGECVVTGVRGELNSAMVDVQQGMLSRGEGQLVAVIDSGVQPSPRLPNVVAGGDYLARGDGLTDCDGHGTLVAGLIAGQPGPDGFSGIAPAARILAIRQSSPRFSPAARVDATQVALDTLARAVVHAADLDATVIVIPTAVCTTPDKIGDQQALGAALRYAAIDRNVVIVAAAGDTGASGGGLATQCAPNATNVERWDGVTSVSTPSWWQPYVLSVGAVTDSGVPADFTMPGPWVGVAAAAENVVSVSNDPAGGLANGMPDGRGGLIPLDGTGYAAAYVAGAAAVVRSRYPDLSARQVIERLSATASRGARASSQFVGSGVVDPIAALSWVLEPTAAAPAPTRVDGPASTTVRDSKPFVVAVVGTAALIGVVGLAAAFRRRKAE